ncbi:MAG: signal recognition particle-docking protein FtsY [Treponema sp.]|jgi:fused signal recognition particle receptor|nr:signal recognition particle-docking protein FtsY [Treponema sp.]
MAKFTAALKFFFGVSKAIDDAFYDDLADLLVEGDFGPAESFKLVKELRELARKEKITLPGDLRERFAALLLSMLVPANAALPNPAVILLLGVNGVGKTTTAAKLAWRQNKAGRKTILAAADTFRAAAIDQIKIHGERINVRVIAHQHGGDPAAVVYDAAEAALSGGGDLVIADTAGRMHTKNALLEELKKIDRVLETKMPSVPVLKYLVLDATTGRNALAQAEIFHGAVRLDGAILTKYDSLARGGVVFSLASQLKLPLLFIANGEGYEHLFEFDPAAFVKEFTGFSN